MSINHAEDALELRKHDVMLAVEKYILQGLMEGFSKGDIDVSTPLDGLDYLCSLIERRLKEPGKDLFKLQRAMNSLEQRISSLESDEAAANTNDKTINVPVVFNAAEPKALQSTGHIGATASDAPEVAADYSLKLSVYDSFMLLGMKDQSILDMTCHVSVALAYVVVIVCFMYVLSDGFSSPAFGESELQSLQIWRVAEGHSINHYDDYRGLSLASRVCGSDAGLTVGTNQQSIYLEILSYQQDAFFDGMQRGPLLCFCCITVWTAIMVHEVQITLYFLMAVWTGHVGSSSTLLKWHDGKCTLESLSIMRRIVGTVCGLLRIFFLILLLYQGTEWLLNTINIHSLLLHTASLSQLLQLDTRFFCLGVTYRFQNVLRKLKPIPTRKIPGEQTMPLCLFTLMIAVTFLRIWFDLLPMLDRMDVASDILCGGNRNFAGSILDGIGVYWAETNHHRELPEDLTSLPRYDAVKSVVEDWDSKRKHTFVVPSMNELNFVSSLTRPEYVRYKQTVSCADMPNHVGMHIWTVTRDESVKDFSSCQDVKQFCSSVSELGHIVRTFCPMTCQCFSYASGLVFLNAHAEGCMYLHEPGLIYAPDCPQQHLVDPTIFTRACTDYNMSFLQHHTGWATFLQVIEQASKWLNGTVSGIPMATYAYQKLSAMGCEALQHPNLPNYTAYSICTGLINVNIRKYVGSPASWFCPMSCGCQMFDYLGNVFITAATSIHPVHNAACPNSCERGVGASGGGGSGG